MEVWPIFEHLCDMTAMLPGASQPSCFLFLCLSSFHPGSVQTQQVQTHSEHLQGATHWAEKKSKQDKNHTSLSRGGKTRYGKRKWTGSLTERGARSATAAGKQRDCRLDASGVHLLKQLITGCFSLDVDLSLVLFFIITSLRCFPNTLPSLVHLLTWEHFSSMDNPLDSLLRCEHTAQRQSDGERGDQSRQCWLPDFGDGAPDWLSSSK